MAQGRIKTIRVNAGDNLAELIASQKGRIVSMEVDLADGLENWLQQYAILFSTSLQGAKLLPAQQYGNNLASLGYYREDTPKEALAGHISGYLEFEIKAPKFVTEDDGLEWYNQIQNVSERFGVRLSRPDSENPVARHYFSINFSEAKPDEFYALNKNKQEQIKVGYEKVRKYVDFFKAAVVGYGKVRQIYEAEQEKMLDSLQVVAQKMLANPALL